ncbi:MAG: FadR/GntR family transcriptional regulator [Lachnospiraceae bacterium]
MQENVRVSLSDTILEKLETMISTMKPGERLPTEKELSEEFGVGRSTIRESMKVLSARRMVVRRNEGTFVADAVKGCLIDPLNLIINMQAENINYLIELREILELSSSRIAAQRASDEDVAELKRALWLTKEPGLTREESQKRDIAFHNAIAHIAGNPVIEELLNAVRVVIAQNVESDPTRENIRFGKERNYHDEMVEAIEEQDPEKAYLCTKEYLEEVYKTIGI